MAYLGYRDPLPVWSSPGIIMPPQHFDHSAEKWLAFAAKFVQAAMDFKHQLDLGRIPIDMSGARPMDMRQYYRLFGATRIPGPEKDGQILTEESTYAMVAHQGHVMLTRNT